MLVLTDSSWMQEQTAVFLQKYAEVVCFCYFSTILLQTGSLFFFSEMKQLANFKSKFFG